MRVKNTKKDNRRWLWAVGIITLIAFIQAFICGSVFVSGTSMEPTLKDNQVIFVNKIAYVCSEPQKGDVVIAIEPISNKHVVKRVTGVSGEIVFYNGEPIALAEGQYFIEGDNANSTDSKIYGPVVKDRIVAKVIGI